MALRILGALRALGTLKALWAFGASLPFLKALLNILDPEKSASYPLPLPGGVPQVVDALFDDIYAISVRGREP